jgi:hypothetical protein
MAAACALGLVVVGLLALASDAGHARDSVIMHGFSALYRRRLELAIEITGRLSDPLPYAFLGSLCIGMALARRRTRRAVAIGIVLVATGAIAQGLKHLLAQPRYADWLGWRQLDETNWPSGHTTAAMTLALCAVVAAPPAWRAATALIGAALAVAVAYATLALTWHYPSDVLAGFLLAALGVSAALAVLAPSEADDPEPPVSLPVASLLIAGAAGTIVAAAVVGAASGSLGLGGSDRVTIVVGAAVIAATAVTLVIATTVAASTGRGET